MIARRSFLADLTAALCAPAIVRTPGLLMPVRAVKPPMFSLAPGSVNYADWRYEDGIMVMHPVAELLEDFSCMDRKITESLGYSERLGVFYRRQPKRQPWAGMIA